MQKCVHLVDLVKSFQTMQHSALIQPIKGLLAFAKNSPELQVRIDLIKIIFGRNIGLTSISDEMIRAVVPARPLSAFDGGIKEGVGVTLRSDEEIEDFIRWWVSTLVERFAIEPFSDFSAK